MACTTILVGKGASYDGSTIVARNEDSQSGVFTPKYMDVVEPQDQPRTYVSKGGHLTIQLPDNPVRYTQIPDAEQPDGVWGAAGVNELNVAMSATETITSNERVLAADPLVEYVPARGDGPERAGGIGEEDMVTICLPYITSARDGVMRMGELLERYGTYEMNGMAFQDADEIWWLETIGGHHWMARRVPDDCYVTMPNQLGIDAFDFADAAGEGREFLCSADLEDFVRTNHLDLGLEGDAFDPRAAFGSATQADHVYNTPRAWYMQRTLNPYDDIYDGELATLRPDSDDIPWCRVPERKVTIQDVKQVLSSHYEGTPYDPYGRPQGDGDRRGTFRPIGINRNSQLSITQLKADAPEAVRAIQWVAFGCNVFNVAVPLFANVDRMPDYLANTTRSVSTDSHYWAVRLVSAMADAHFADCANLIERYQEAAGSEMLREVLAAQRDVADKSLAYAEASPVLEEANDRVAAILRRHTDNLLSQVLHTASMGMRNGFARSDA